MGQSPKLFGGEGGKKVRPADAGPKARSQNIRPIQLIRACALQRRSVTADRLQRYARKNFFAKRRMRAGRCAPRLRDKQVRLSELEVTCYAKSPNMFCFIQFIQRRICDASARRGKIDNERSR